MSDTYTEPIRRLLDYARLQFGTEPDHPFPGDDITSVLRHADSGKWYAILMTVPRARLGLSGEDEVWIMNLKTDPVLRGSLTAIPGFLPAYHMNRTHWITVLLDGTAEPDTVYELLCLSYRLTGPKKSARRSRGEGEAHGTHR